LLKTHSANEYARSISDPYRVVEVNDTASDAALGQELELGSNVVWQCALATTDDDRAKEPVKNRAHDKRPRKKREGSRGSVVSKATTKR
jgi:hypothetical protein